MLDFIKLSATYQEALLAQVVPFWLKYSRDERCGGYFDALTGLGEVIEADKVVALQAQQVWSFAWLYNTVEAVPAWLSHAQHGAAFLYQHAHDETLGCYALLDRRGTPVAPAADVRSQAYTVMAYVQMYKATGNDEWAMLAKQTLKPLLERRVATRAKLARNIGGFRQWQQLQEPVVVLKALLDTRTLLSEEDWKDQIDVLLDELLNEFLDKRQNILRTTVLPEGAFTNTPEGRQLSPGLTFEAANYLLDVAFLTSNRKLAMQVVTWCLAMCEWAWDDVEGGLHQFVDFKNQPIVSVDWQQRWAWVHLEALSVLSKGYFHTHHPDCPRWFQRIHEFVFQYFPDPKQLGWHLALDPVNKPLLTVKAIPTVGCFYLIKCLGETAATLTQCAQLQSSMKNTRVM